MPRSERTPPKGNAGFSLIEALVVLAILAGLAAVVATRGGGPSDTLLLKRRAAELGAEVAQHRLAAARAGEGRVLTLPGADCGGEDQEVRVFADGTGADATICLDEGDRRLVLHLDGLTGRLAEAEPER